MSIEAEDSVLLPETRRLELPSTGVPALSSSAPASHLPLKGLIQYQLVLAGNPNSGKTTLFNLLTGHRHKVANYPGVTVERKVGNCSALASGSVEVVDLPGIYSLAGQSEDEIIAERELRSLDTTRAIVIAVTDASNLERNLFLVTELIESGIPLIVALNMSDVATRDGLVIHEALLERALGVPVVRLTATKKEGLNELISAIDSVIESSGPHQSRARGESRDNEAEVAFTLTASELGLKGVVAISTDPSKRYQKIREIVRSTISHSATQARRRSDQVDRLLLHPIWGLLIFALIMGALFQSIFTWASYPADLIDKTVSFVGQAIERSLPGSLFRSLLVDGVIAGAGSVLVFVPQIAILFFLLGVLENSGYLCRAAFLMDRAMRSVGLQGRSFIPLLSSFSCAVPAIMSARSIPSRGDRLLTILIAPLMSCSARLPVYTVIIGAFVPNIGVLGPFRLPGLVLLGLYLVGVIAAAFVSLIFKKLLFRDEPALFLMEMPRYKIPSIKGLVCEVWDRVEVFVKNAGTVILACSVVLWFLATFPQSQDPAAGKNLKGTYAGQIGQAMEPIIKPLGYNWEIGVSLLASFAAREVFVSSLSTIYNLETDDTGTQSLIQTLRRKHSDGTGFGVPTALSLLVFYVLACQCMSTLAVCRRETGSWAWPILMFSYMTVLAYGSAWVTYRIALLFAA